MTSVVPTAGSTPAPAGLPYAGPAVRPVGAGTRRAWRISGAVLAVVALAYGALTVLNQLSHEERTATFSYPASSVRSVTVDTDVGDVNITAATGPTVSVRVHISDGLVKTDHSQRLSGGRLALDASCPVLVNFCRADYTVSVPPSMRVVARTGHGDVTVTGIGGGLDISSDHGDVTATRVRASTVHASAGHGDVQVEFARPPARVDAQAGHGDVTIDLPNVTSGYRVDATSDKGSVDTQVRTDPHGDRVITAHSDHGDVTIRPALTR